MRRAVLLLAVPLILGPLVLAGCGHHAREETTTTVTKDGVTTTTVTTRTRGHHDAADDGKTISGLNIDTDKFKANLEIPGMSFGADDMDMDGMKLYPGSRVKGVRVKASDRDGDKHGTVTMDFTSPAAPAAVADHMGAQAKKAGFTVSGASAAGLTGTKAEDKEANSFTVTLSASGDATVGQMVMTGSKEKSGWN
jgi:hypothetical protein